MTTVRLTPEQAATVIVALCENAKAAFLPTTLELIESDGALGEALAEIETLKDSLSLQRIANEALSDNLYKAHAENESLKARLAELEAETTPPELPHGVPAGSKLGRFWVAPPSDENEHALYTLDGMLALVIDTGNLSAQYGVTFP